MAGGAAEGAGNGAELPGGRGPEEEGEEALGREVLHGLGGEKIRCAGQGSISGFAFFFHMGGRSRGNSSGAFCLRGKQAPTKRQSLNSGSGQQGAKGAKDTTAAGLDLRDD